MQKLIYKLKLHVKYRIKTIIWERLYVFFFQFRNYFDYIFAKISHFLKTRPKNF